MRIHKDLKSEGISLRSPVITVGTFDGVHTGHGEILKQVAGSAHSAGGESVVFTFNPHPRMVLFPNDRTVKLLTTCNEKAGRIAAYGIQHLIEFKFTREFSRLTALEFVRDILVNKLGMKKLVIGYDHHFGRNREGSIEHLRELGPLYGFEIEEIPARIIDENAVSSTKIRMALQHGIPETANQYLGYTYSVTGTVVKGEQLGKKLGYPTANIQPDDPNKLIPARGVYAVTVKHEQRTFTGMMNIGSRPTVSSQDVTKTEVHLFNCNEDLYEKPLTVAVHHRLRDEKRFANIAALREQLMADETAVKQYFQSCGI